MTWYYATGEQQTGPITDAELEQLVSAGTVNANTLVWHEGMTEWQPYGRVRPASPEAAPATGVVCSECGKTFPLDEVIQHGNVYVCAACKPVFVQKLKEGAAPAMAMEYAGFWIRAGATIIDGLILFAVNTVIHLIAGVPLAFGQQRNPRAAAAFIGLQMLLVGVQLAIEAAYQTWFVGKYGATPGKMACKLRVVTAEGEKVSYARALGRHFAKYLSQMICFIGYLMVAFDKEEHRGLHDRICNTRVIFNRESAVG